MKQLILVALLALTACRQHTCTNATVVKDCTGTYIRINGKDYHVCNREKTDSFADGTAVSVEYKTISNCNGTAKDDIVCLMIHENEGWIEVKSIKP